MDKPVSILYAGSPDCAARLLRALLDSQREAFFIAGALTNPPSARGRGSSRLEPTPVALCAQEAGGRGFRFPVFAPEKLDSAARDAIAALGCDMLVCFSYGKIFGPKFLSLFRMGAINVHPSLLPKYRGAIPVPQAILNRDRETGVSIQKIAQRMDAGNVLAQKTIALNGTETADELLARLSGEAAPLLLGVLDAAFSAGALPEGEPQDDSSASYCVKLQKEDGLIDWNQSAFDIDAKIRAFTPWPGTFTFHDGGRIQIHKAKVVREADARQGDSPGAGGVAGVCGDGIMVKTGDGILALQIVQRQGKKALAWRDFLNGNKAFLNARLTALQA